MAGLILPYGKFSPVLAADVFIAPGAMVIGDVEIGEGSSIWYNAVVRGDVNYIRIGENTNLQDGAVVHGTSGGSPAIIGSNITIGHNAVVHACTIEDYCLIGMNSTVLDGAVVETGSMVAAGALVANGKRVKSGELWAGNPARKMRDLTAEENEFIRQAAKGYRKLAREHAGSVP